MTNRGGSLLRWAGVFGLYALMVPVVILTTILHWTAALGFWIADKLSDAIEAIKPDLRGG